MIVLTLPETKTSMSSTDVIGRYESKLDFVLNDPTNKFHGKLCSCRNFIGQSVELCYGKHNEHKIVHTFYN